MPEIWIDESGIQAGSGDNLLDTLLAAGHRVPWSCRSGHCQTCLVQALDGQVPEQATAGLAAGRFHATRARETAVSGGGHVKGRRARWLKDAGRNWRW